MRETLRRVKGRRGLPEVSKETPDLGSFVEVVPVHKHLTCSCGYVVHADSDEEMVRKAQDHAKSAHGKAMSREDILKMAKEAKH